MKRIELFFLKAILMAGVVAGCFLPNVYAVENESLEKGLLAENWQYVLKVCQTPNSQGTVHPTVLKAIMGHACHALNRNNESVAFFSQLPNDPNINEWEKWTSGFAERNPHNPVALYLKGDAIARQGRWKESIQIYSVALRTLEDVKQRTKSTSGVAGYVNAIAKLKWEQTIAMTLNARGVAYAHQRKVEKSFDDFLNASYLWPGLADVHANLGTYLLLTEAAPGALEEYNLALNLSRGFSLALNGRACAQIGFSRDPNSVTKAMNDFTAAQKQPQVKVLVESNIGDIMAMCLDGNDEKVADSNEGAHLSAKQLMGVRSDIVQYRLKTSSPEYKSRLLKQIDSHISHNEMGLQLFGGTKAKLGFSIDGRIKGILNDRLGAGYGGGLTGEMVGSSKVFESRLTNNITELKALRQDIISTMPNNGPGGAETEGGALKYSSGDVGIWPARNMWFGLFPKVGLPEPFLTHSESKEKTNAVL